MVWKCQSCDLFQGEGRRWTRHFTDDTLQHPVCGDCMYQDLFQKVAKRNTRLMEMSKYNPATNCEASFIYLDELAEPGEPIPLEVKSEEVRSSEEQPARAQLPRKAKQQVQDSKPRRKKHKKHRHKDEMFL